LTKAFRGESRGMLQLRGEQNSNYLLRKTKLKAKFLLSYTGVRRTLNTPLAFWIIAYNKRRGRKLLYPDVFVRDTGIMRQELGITMEDREIFALELLDLSSRLRSKYYDDENI